MCFKLVSFWLIYDFTPFLAFLVSSTNFKNQLPSQWPFTVSVSGVGSPVPCSGSLPSASPPAAATTCLIHTLLLAALGHSLVSLHNRTSLGCILACTFRIPLILSPKRRGIAEERCPALSGHRRSVQHFEMHAILCRYQLLEASVCLGRWGVFAAPPAGPGLCSWTVVGRTVLDRSSLLPVGQVSA